MSRFTDLINTGDEELAEELISPKAIFHVPGGSEPMRGAPGYLEIIAMMRAGFPDIQWTLEGLIAEGDKIAARFTMRGPQIQAVRRIRPRRPPAGQMYSLIVAEASGRRPHTGGSRWGERSALMRRD